MDSPTIDPEIHGEIEHGHRLPSYKFGSPKADQIWFLDVRPEVNEEFRTGLGIARL